MQLLARPYPIYIVLTPFRDLGPSVRVLFRGLERLEPYLSYAEGFYRDDDDEALFGLQFDRDAVMRIGAQKFIGAVSRCNLPVIAPEELSLEKRVSFNHEHLATFPTYIQQYRNPDESLLQGMIVALEEHVSTQAPDEHYDFVELSVAGSVVPVPVDDEPDDPEIITSARRPATNRSFLDDEAIVDESFPEELIEPIPPKPQLSEEELARAGIPVHIEQRPTSQWEIDLDESSDSGDPFPESDAWL